MAVTSLSFDIAGLELWLPLTVGAHVTIAGRDTAGNGNALKALLEAHKSTVLQATPSTFRLLIEAGWRGSPVLKVLVGGEAVPGELAEQLIERAHSVWNMYGPTETTIWSTIQPLRRGEPVTIGRPIANTTVYILDRHLRPVPQGISGELYLGGDGLARGYLGRPELTNERFIANPFVEGVRIYRTGDLARYRDGGVIDYQGRNDLQVKLRGYRIELGEIESVLAKHPAIREAVVTAYNEGPGDQRLAAYVTTHDATPTVDELRAHLKAKLPEYMVPARFIVLEKLPLTANNKIDRKALPPPGPAPASASAAAEEHPRDATEAKVAAIFRAVLGLPSLRLTDDFFDLGGHSLLALRLVAQIESAFGHRLPMSSLLRAATVADVSAILRAGGATMTSSLVALRERGVRPPVYWLPGGGGLSVLAFRKVSELLGEDQPVYGLEARTDPQSGLEDTDVPKLAAQYIRDIQALKPEGPYHLFGFCNGSWVAYEMARRLQEQGQKVGLLVMFDTPWVGAETNWLNNLRIRLQRERFHLHNLPRDPIELGKYFYDRIDYGADLAKERVARVGFVLARKLFGKLGGPMPKALTDVDNTIRQAIHEYARSHAGTVLEGRITIVLARQTSMAGVDRSLDPRLGWRRVAQQGIEVHEVSGTHLTMLQPPYVFELAETLRTCLEQAS
jgi:thioesterase domain-containing protein/acyl carrier protein